MAKQMWETNTGRRPDYEKKKKMTKPKPKENKFSVEGAANKITARKKKMQQMMDDMED